MEENKNSISLIDIYEKLIIIETKLNDILKINSVSSSDIIKVDEVNPFINPETGLNDVIYYRLEHPKEERK